MSNNNNDDDDTNLECYISFENVKKEIMTYLDKHKHARTGDIVFDLCIDIDLVVEALNVLEEEGLVEGKNIPLKVE